MFDDRHPEARIGAAIDGQGSAVVLLHSSMSSKAQWRPLTERLRGSHRLIAVDLYGYGDTSWPRFDRPLTLADEALLVRTILARELQAGERFHLVGHSYGGVVALHLAQTMPQQLHSLCLFEPGAFHLLSPGDPLGAEINEVRDRVAGALARGSAADATRYFIDYWNGAGSFARIPQARQQALARLVPKSLLDFGAVAAETQLAGDYRRILAPACVLLGSTSPQAAQRASDIVVDRLPRASRHRVAGGHMAPVTDPELVNPIIEGFIRSVDEGEPRWA